MAEESAFRGIIGFLDKIGVYDIVLPFLLVFTIMFAILEKTKILGVEKVGDNKESPKKNLNSMVAFVIAFLVIASTQLVATINKVMADIVLLAILGVSFLLLTGIFFTGKDEFTLKEHPRWQVFFMVLMFIGIVLIFLNALDWLKFVFAVFVNWQAEWAATIIFLIVILGFIWFITNTPETEEEKKKRRAAAGGTPP